MKTLKQAEPGNLLISYYNQREWAIYEIVGVEGSGNRKKGYKEAIVISDMTIGEWKREVEFHPHMKEFYFDSLAVRRGNISRIKDNASDPRVKAAMRTAIRKVMENEI